MWLLHLLVELLLLMLLLLSKLNLLLMLLVVLVHLQGPLLLLERKQPKWVDVRVDDNAGETTSNVNILEGILPVGTHVEGQDRYRHEERHEILELREAAIVVLEERTSMDGPTGADEDGNDARREFGEGEDPVGSVQGNTLLTLSLWWWRWWWWWWWWKR